MTVKSEDLQTDKNKQNKEEVRPVTYWLRLLLKSKTGTLGLIIVLIIVCVAPLAGIIAPHDPTQMDATKMLTPPAWLEGGSMEYILGTDNLGRDIFSRILYGTRISLLVGITSVIIAGAIGIALGLLSGYYGGLIDTIIMRIVDAFLAIPGILITLVILSVVGPGLWTLIIVLGITNWVEYTRVVRGEVLSVKEREYVKAAKSIGVSDLKIMMKHLLPNVASSFIVISTLSVASTIIAEASLSFLGMGIQPPTVSWGVMLNIGKDYLAESWWVATFPGLAITFTTLGIIFLGDWLRDILDPRIQMNGK